MGRTLSVIVMLGVLGCGASQSEPVVNGGDLAGKYVLKSLNTQNVPILVEAPPLGCYSITVVSGALDLQPNHTFRETVEKRRDGCQPGTFFAADSGTWTQSGDTLRWTSTDGYVHIPAIRSEGSINKKFEIYNAVFNKNPLP